MLTNEVIHLLKQEYGPRKWHPHHDPLSELILTILSQNTTDLNTRRTFSSLVSTFGNWEEVANGDVERIAEAIKSGGLAKIKASRIKLILNQILERNGSLDISFLKEFSIPEARTWLQEFSGVGPKTANCVLLFAFGKPAFPVDTHVYRVSRRLGLLNSKVPIKDAHEILENLTPKEDIYEFHLNLVEHGRRVCHARQPQCPKCVLKEICPSAILRD
jgi:endonuclease-3